MSKGLLVRGRLQERSPMMGPFRCLLLAFVLPSIASAQIAVRPALYAGGPTSMPWSARPLVTPDTAPRHIIALAAPGLTASDLNATGRAPTNRSTSANRRRLIEVGFARPVPDLQQRIDLAALPWQAVSGGGKAARVEVRSPGAAAVRLGLEVSGPGPGVTFRFAGSNRPKQTFSPIPVSAIAPSKLYWSPILEGEAGTLEINVPPGVDASGLRLRVSQISHLFVAGAAILKSQPVDDIGASEACEVDLACTAPSQALLDQARAVAKLLFTRDGNTYLCTGTMLNDAASSFTPYLFTASQCIDSQEAAS